MNLRLPALRQIPVRPLLLIGAVMLVLPGLLFGAILLDEFAENERADSRRDLIAAASRLSDMVDRETSTLFMAARMLALSGRTTVAELATVAAEIGEDRGVLRYPVLVAAPDGSLPMEDQGARSELSPLEIAAVKRAAAQRRVLISGLVTDSAAGPHMLVLAPVIHDGEVVRVVGLFVPPSFLADILLQQALPEGWVAAIRGRDGELLARSRDSVRFLGTKLDDQFKAVGDGHVTQVTTLDGTPAWAVTTLIPSAGWHVRVAVESAVTDAPIRQSQLLLALTGVSAIVFALILAWQLALYISVPLSALARAGADLGAGRPVSPVSSGITEVEAVSAALVDACLQLRERGQMLAAERARLAAIIETVPVGLLIADATGAEIAGNRELTRMLAGGPGDGGGHALAAVDEAGRPVPDEAMPLRRAFAGEDPAELRCRFHRGDGSLFWAQAVAAPIVSSRGEITGAVLALLDTEEAVRARQQKDRWAEQLEAEVRIRTRELEKANQQLMDEISARGRAEDQLRQSQKMEAVGRLTGGIAHDFNNLLTVILGSLELLRRRVGDARAVRLVDSAMDGANRAAELISRLLAFSRRQPLQPQRLDVNKLVQGMSSLLRRSLGETIAVATRLEDGLWQAMADPNQLESALLNLAVNARDAILAASPGGGHLRIETANVTVSADDAARGQLRPGDYVQITTADDGSGMSPETLAQVFEPFFTTKPLGKGTGLGLSQVHGFAVQSGGYVTIESGLGQGTAVRLSLPRATVETQPEHEAVPRATPPAVQPGAAILLVEDEPAVRLFTAEALRLLGYSVLEACGGDQALSILDRHSEIALVMSDVVMPGMNGRELARLIQRRRPELPILLASGYNRAGDDTEDKTLDLLPKPFTVVTLAEKINAIFDQRRHRVADADPSRVENSRVDA